MTDQPIPSDLLHRAKVIGGLRQLADYLDAHPGAPVPPFGWELATYPRPRHREEAAARTEVDRIAAVLGAAVTDDRASGGHYATARSFGLITYRAVVVPDRRAAIYHALITYRGCVIPDDTEVTR